MNPSFPNSSLSLRPSAQEEFATVALWSIPGLSARAMDLLRERLGSLEAALHASKAELRELGILETVAERVVEGGARRRGEWVLERCRKEGISICLPMDPAWPKAFDRLTRPPALLFKRGGCLPATGIAIVGSRKADAYGLRFSEQIGSDLSHAGLTVVSGGALGVDGAAHRGALSSPSTALPPTLAVLGTGLDILYPPGNQPLLERVVESGTLVSEFPPSTPPLPAHFPRRNRLIAGLAEAVVVVRAAPRSGSLITARVAKEMDIPVWAVPGPAGEALSEGCHRLLREGAQLCTGAEDLLRSLHRPSLDRVEHRASTPMKEARPMSPEMNRLCALLSSTPITLDELGRTADLKPSVAAVAVTRLEMLGLAIRSPGNHFSVGSDLS